MALTQEQLHHYHEQGWVVVPHFVDKATVARIKKEIGNPHETMLNGTPKGVHIAWEDHQPAGTPKRILQLMGSELVSPELNRVIRSPEMLDIIEQIIGPEIILYHSKLLMKAPHIGESHFPWHQDFQYWQYSQKQPTQINCALAIDPQTIENGCLHYVPGSHKQGLRPHDTFKASAFAIGMAGDIHAFPGLPVEYDAGDICLFGSLVIHGSEQNRSDSSAVFNTCAYDIPDNFKDVALKSEVLRTRVAA